MIVLGSEPGLVKTGTTAGRRLASEGRLDEALDVLLAATTAEPDDVEAHLAIYEVAQVLRRPQLALDHQRRAIALAPIHSTPASEREEYALLVPCVPGPFTANTPVDLLFDRRSVTLHRWYVDPAAAVPPLPAHDAVFVAAGESTAAQPALAMLDRLLASRAVPAINRPAAIARLGRVDVSRDFMGAPGCRTARTARVARSAYERDGFPFAHIARPVDTHGGTGMERIASASERDAFLQRTDARELYLTEYIDYRSADGFFRKYRIIFVDGVPWPFHLAISPHWMVHYYNAAMDEHQWMRDEEHAFLAGFDRVFGGALAEALREVARRLPLEYFGIDCAIDRDGALVIFEADNALIVHALDDPAKYGYKHAYVPRILAAVDAMVRRRIARPPAQPA